MPLNFSFKFTEDTPIERRVSPEKQLCTGFSSEIGTKLRDWAIGQAGAGCYSQAALSSNDSKTRYTRALRSSVDFSDPYLQKITNDLHVIANDTSFSPCQSMDKNPG